MKRLIVLLLLAAIAVPALAQELPFQMHYSNDGHRLITGGVTSKGVFKENEIHSVQLWFDQNNYWTQLTANYNSGTDLAATMIIDGDTLPAKVGVRFKGQTSYNQLGTSQKKSFNITLDFVDPEQDYKGYETFNLNNCFLDPSFVREASYYSMARNYAPAPMVSYTSLSINGQDWGIYPMVQQVDGDFIKDWLFDNDGTRWRALKTGATGGGPGGGNPFGTGFSSMNWLGTTDSSEYKKYYTLKKTSKTRPWDDLIKAIQVLNNTPAAQLETELNKYMDVDRTLWNIANEIVFSDDDSYIFKGGMDYYIYWDSLTRRLFTFEYDGNTCLDPKNASWGPFYKETDTKYALVNKIWASPALRQRYLAHVRTIVKESFESGRYNEQVDNYKALIDSMVNADPKKIYSYSQFTAGITEVKTVANTRKTTLLNNAEMKLTGPSIGTVTFGAKGIGNYQSPSENQEVMVSTSIAHSNGVAEVRLYYGTGLYERFDYVNMYDDGMHEDGAAGDGIYGGTLPGQALGTYVRFYIAAYTNNASKTVSYMPEGAEHDVFIYQVKNTVAASDVVINEVMASNTSTAADQDGEYDDWIELYNNSSSEVDLSGWFMSDNPANLQKYEIPAGTKIAGNGYLIIWADENGKQTGLHANFKLSASGEVLYLINNKGETVQEVTFGQQETDKGYARVPNGTGNFVIQNPTFNANNGGSTSASARPQFQLAIYPNPAQGQFILEASGERLEQAELAVFTVYGQLIHRNILQAQQTVQTADWTPGMYLVKAGNTTVRLVVE